MLSNRLIAFLTAAALMLGGAGSGLAQTATDADRPGAAISAPAASQSQAGGQPPGPVAAAADPDADGGQAGKQPPAVENPMSPALVTAEEELARAEAEMASLLKRVEDNASDDNALVDLKLETEALSREMLDLGLSLRPILTEVKARLEQLGQAPAEGEPPEPDSVTAERMKLAQERATINSLTGRAETVSVRASETGDAITAMRRDLFAGRLLNRTEIGPALLSQAGQVVAEERDQLSRTFGSWFRFVWTFKWEALMVWVFFTLLAALIFVPGAYRLFGGLINRDPYEEDPPYTSRLSVAFWATVIPTVAMTLLTATTYLLAESLSILRLDVAPVIRSMLGTVVGVYFVGKLARAVLAPKLPAWRLVNITNRGARLLYPMVIALVVVNGIDFVLSEINRTLGSPVVLTVAQGFFSVVIMALILIGMALVKPMPARSGDPADPGEHWPRVILAALLVAGVGLLATAMLGYVGLARFAATQIVVTGAILTTMYIGFLSGRAVSESDAFSQTAVGRWLETRYELSQVSLDQAGLAAGLLINLLVLCLGLPLIFLQWGFQIQDIELWFYRLVTDIRIGGITISLVGILFGIVLFIIGLIVTRWFQHWLDGSVMSRGRLDTGVRNSIKTGVGYLGVAIAGLIGISAAGIDLSSLALVAGALSLGIGFGLQNIVSNFVSGLILLAERPFKVGDWVSTATTEGFVKKISVRATEIETFTRQSIIVPNSELINSPVGNWTHRNKLGRVDVPVGVSYDSNPREVVAMLVDIAAGHDLVLRNPEPVVHFTGFGDSSLDFVLKCYVADVLSGIGVRTELSLRIFERFKEQQIEIPFPQRDLNIKMDGNGEAIATLVEKSGALAGEPRPKPKRAAKTRDDIFDDDGDGEGGDR